jgi:hypothetical protein
MGRSCEGIFVMYLRFLQPDRFLRRTLVIDSSLPPDLLHSKSLSHRAPCPWLAASGDYSWKTGRNQGLLAHTEGIEYPRGESDLPFALPEIYD